MTLRLLTTADLPQALALSTSAGWNQTAADWQRLLDLAPESCFGIELDGCLAATATLLPYGRSLGWLGMVLTRRDYRHRGLASRLVEHALKLAGTLGIETVKLDATDQGQPIYEKLGFAAERRIERWSWTGLCGANADAGASVPLESLAGLDYEAFGADRMGLLTRLAAPGRATASGVRDKNARQPPTAVRTLQRPAGSFKELGALLVSPGGVWSHAALERRLTKTPCLPACGSRASMPVVTAHGFAFWRPGRIANYAGPCVAQTQDAAGRLIAGCLVQAAGPWMWDVFPDNAPGIELARQFGFQPVRRLVRMRRGRPIAEQPGSVYAAAGFEFG